MRLPRLGAVAALLTTLAGCIPAPTPSEGTDSYGPRAGQILFIPWARAEFAESQGSADLALLQISLCEPTSQGLALEGHVDRADSTTTVAVAAAELDVMGARIGMNELVDSGLPGAAPGDFQVVLPWAGPNAGFALVEKGVVVGSVVNCPAVGDGGSSSPPGFR